MDEREANIDVLFRNGLKDLEVLPPAEVWENVRPAVRKNQRPLLIFRAAAMIAVIISLGFLSYRWSLRISPDLASNNPAARTSVIPDLTLKTPPAAITNPSSDGRIFLSENLNPGPTPGITEPVIKAGEQQGITGQTYAGSITLGNPAENGKKDLISSGRQSAPVLNLPLNPPPYEPEIQGDQVGKRWSIAALVSPTYYSTYLSGNSSLANQLSGDEQSRMSYSGGVSLEYRINKRFSIQSGLYYSSIAQTLTGVSLYQGFSRYDVTKGDHNFELLTSTGAVYTSNADVFLSDPMSPDRVITRYTRDVFDPVKANLTYLDNSLRQNFSFLELPVVLRYKIVDKNIDFNLIGGFSSNVLVGNNVYAMINSGKLPVGKTGGISTITFSSSLGMGMEYSFTKNLSFNVEPTLRYYLNSFDEMSGIKIHPYSFGIFSGLSFKF